MSKFRILKIHSKYQSRRNGEAQIPEIKLLGKWLAKLGFKQGKTVKIEQEINKLTITINSDIDV
jgi:hypothetical protein